jgi:hypothetical protein
MNKLWAVILTAVLVVVVGGGLSVKLLNDHQNTSIAQVQLQVKTERDAAAAAAAKVKADTANAAAAAKAKAAADAAKAKAAKQATDLAKAQKDAADAKAAAQAAQSRAAQTPQVIVVPGPAAGAAYYDSSSASATLNTYFDSISSGDYATAYAQLSPSEQAKKGSLSAWSSGLLTSVDTNVVVNSVNNLGGGTIVANVSFHSHQSPDNGVNPGETETNWNIDYTMVPGPGAGGYQISDTSNASHSAGY